MNRIIVFCLMLVLPAGVAFAGDYAQPAMTDRDDVRALIDQLVEEEGFDSQQLYGWMSQAQRKESIIKAISRPAEKAKPWKDYRNIFIQERRIREGTEFWQKYKETLERACKTYGVPEEVIVAIIGVETYYGGNMGSYRVVDALATLGFDYPKRGKFFTKQLYEFFLLTREQGLDPLSLYGSYAGAMGYGQFIPSSYRAYAVDFDGDGVADIWNNPVDAIGSVANYFAEHGWRYGETVVVEAAAEEGHDVSVLNDQLKPERTVSKLKKKGIVPKVDIETDQLATAMKLEAAGGTEYWMGLHNFYVITRYNHSRLYAMAVHQLSQEIKDRM